MYCRYCVRWCCYCYTTLLWIEPPPLKKKWKTGYYSFQILKIKKWKRGSIFFKNFAALRAGFYSFQKCCGGVLFLRNLLFVFSSILHCKTKKVVKIPPQKNRRALRGVLCFLKISQKGARGSIFFKFSFSKSESGVLFFSKYFPKRAGGVLKRGVLFTIGW